jgi:uncharacterized membrane protein
MNGQKALLAFILVLGIIDASYLTVVHFLPSALRCPTIGTIINCENVLTSGFSAVFGIPLAVLGLLWFIASSLFLLLGYNKIVKNIWMIIGVGGVIYSLAAQSIIGKVCIYCTSLDVFIALSVGLFLYIKN